MRLASSVPAMSAVSGYSRLSWLSCPSKGRFIELVQTPCRLRQWFLPNVRILVTLVRRDLRVLPLYSIVNAAECDDGAISPIDHVNANHDEWLHGASYQLGSSRTSRRKTRICCIEARRLAHYYVGDRQNMPGQSSSDKIYNPRHSGRFFQQNA